jgi:hypothetical protein
MLGSLPQETRRTRENKYGSEKGEKIGRNENQTQKERKQ